MVWYGMVWYNTILGPTIHTYLVEVGFFSMLEVALKGSVMPTYTKHNKEKLICVGVN
jgi:hypothetical protein